MLTRLISTVRPLTTTTTSIRLLNISAPRLGDGDQTRSKATEKAAEDLKTRKEKQWIDTPATDSEAVVKGEKQHANKYGDQKKDVTKLQQDTIKAVTEKEEKRHLHERIGSGGSTTKPKKR